MSLKLTPLNLSGFPKLKEMTFGVGPVSTTWVPATLQAGIPGNLRRIVILYSELVARYLPKRVEQEWRDLDRALARLWSSRSIPPEIMSESDPEPVMLQFLPELASMGVAFTGRGSDKAKSVRRPRHRIILVQ